MSVDDDFLKTSNGRFDALLKDGHFDISKLRPDWQKMDNLFKLQKTIGEKKKPLLAIWG